MYETFDFSISGKGQRSLSLFIPDNVIESTQYTRGGTCGVVECLVVGDFQARVDTGATDSDAKTGPAPCAGQNRMMPSGARLRTAIASC